MAACPMYLKRHSYGEYVFDWAWANAYEQHGLSYYPKALVAVPFTPVPGARLLARDDHARTALVQALVAHASAEDLSSLHLLFLPASRHRGLRGRRLDDAPHRAVPLVGQRYRRTALPGL